MLQGGVVPRTAIAGQNAPLVVRFLGKFVLEVLPAALASVIGGVLLAHYQLAHLSTPGPVAEPPAPASAEMVRLVREEHAMIRDFLLAQDAAEKSRFAAADAADVRAAADAELAAAALRRAAATSAGKPTLTRSRPTIMAAATTETVPQAPLVIAQPNESAVPATPVAAAVPPPPVPGAHPSLVATTLALPGHVVGAALHAVSVIGGIPSWIGNRLGSTPS
jgi:hypothetical protein